MGNSVSLEEELVNLRPRSFESRPDGPFEPADVAFWVGALRGAEPLLELPLDFARASSAVLRQEQSAPAVCFSIPDSVAAALGRLARDNGTSLFSILLSAYYVLLSRYSRQSDVVVGTVIRGGGGGSPLANAVALRRPDLGADRPFAALDRDVHAACLDALRQSNAPLRVVRDALRGPEAGEGRGGAHPLFQAGFSLAEDGGGFRSAGFSSPTSALPDESPLDVELRFSLRSGRLRGALAYNGALFERRSAAVMAGHLRCLLASVAAPPSSPPRTFQRLEMMSPHERDTMVNLWNATDAPWPETKCIHTLFEVEAARHPNRVALVADPGPSSAAPLAVTYGELNARCERIAIVLRSLGVGSDVLVALILERGVGMVEAIYGVLKAGGGYVPVDPEYPKARMRLILEDAGVPVLVTQCSLRDRLPEDFGGVVLMVDDLPPPPPVATPPPTHVPAGPASVVYVFYTSGTTGKPKGCVVEHRGLVKRVQWFQDRFPMRPDDCMLQKTTYTFGVSEWEFFWCLPHGATLFMSRPGGHKDPDYLLRVMQSHNITHTCWVPSMLQVQLEHMAMEGANGTTSMKHAFCAGEALSLECCRSFMEGFRGARLHNLYGPTEADMTWWECPADVSAVSKVPIGTPMHNVQVFILDNNGQVCPLNVPGELHFGGANTARGYLHLPQLTAEKFVDNHVTSRGRMYKTGDLARWRPGGYLEFCGRVDHQVKLRGFRVELGDVEAALSSCEGVSLAVVVLRGDTPQTQRLVAYMSPAGVDPKAAEAQMREKLPEYMVPRTYVALAEAEIPRTPTGKINRGALPPPPENSGGRRDSEGYVAPRNKAEEKMARIWMGVLGVSLPPSVEADFLDLGGNSLLAGRTVSIVRKQFSVQIPGTAVYTHPTIEKLCALVAKYHKAESWDDDECGAGSLDPPSYRGKSNTGCCTVLQQLFGLMSLEIIDDGVMWPAFAAGYAAYWAGESTKPGSGAWNAISYLPAIVLGMNFLVYIVTIFLKRCVVGTFKVKPGHVGVRIPMFSSSYNMWWFSRKLIQVADVHVQHLIGETELACTFYRLMGATIGSCVNLDALVHEPEMVSIGSFSDVGCKADVSAVSFAHGELRLDPISIGEHCDIAPGAYVVGGTVLPNNSKVGPLSTTGLGGHRDVKMKAGSWCDAEERQARRFHFFQQTLRCMAGVPVVILAECIPFVAMIYVLEWLWTTLDTLLGGKSTYFVFFCVTPWVSTFGMSEVYFLFVCAFKFLVIGNFKSVGSVTTSPGLGCSTGSDDGVGGGEATLANSHLLSFRRWLLSRLQHSEFYKKSMSHWVWTEVLCYHYRMMGMHVGRRVQPDFIYCVETDLVHVDDYVVMGSGMKFCPQWKNDKAQIILRKDSNVLDRCTLMPGVVVEQDAILGTDTLGPAYTTFKAASISTGNEAGKAVYLRQRGDIVPGSGQRVVRTPEQKMGQVARQRHQSCLHWTLFNVFCIVTTLLLHPLLELLQVATVGIEAILYFGGSGSRFSLALYIIFAPVAYFIINLFHAALVIAAKWIIVGRFKEGNYPFYGQYHYKWVAMMTLQASLKNFIKNIEGTVFGVWYYRAMGAKVGNNTALFSTCTEYDLLEVGDNVVTGMDCNSGCHTVENMVIKLAPVTVQSDCSIQGQGKVMPGGTMERGSILMHLSQVLKGELLPARTTWAGLPARLVSKNSQ